MYGTVANIRVKSGHQGDLTKLMREWDSELRPKIPGAQTGYLVQLDSDPQDMIMIGIFDNKDVYTKNADDPEQDRWFRRMMEHLESEPDWHDGEFSEV